MTKTILVVEAIELDRATVIDALGGGYYVLQVATADAALQVLAASWPHLILCDSDTAPGKGLGLVAAIKGMPRYRFTPIVMLGNVAKAQRDDVRGKFISAWLDKPFAPAVLRQTIERLLSREDVSV